MLLEVDRSSNELQATFRSLDPLTQGLPDAIDAGFLPVNDKQLRNGEGYLSYQVHPSAGLPTGTEVTAGSLGSITTSAARAQPCHGTST